MEQYLLISCIAGIVGAAVYVFTRALIGETDEKLRQRLSNRSLADDEGSGTHAGLADGAAASAAGAVVAILQKIGRIAASPFMPKTREKQSSLRRSLAQAGIYSPLAVTLMTGAKVIFLCVGLLGGYLLGAVFDYPWLLVSLGGLTGYCVPRFWLRMRINRNQRELTIGLPDALDLMVVCVEAGLTVDSAVQRVGQELGLAHPALSRELGMTHMETRVGLSRADAMKNLGLRTANPALQSLSAMLIQAERFGTSIAGALRIHAESLRVKRQHAAEELAAKASVKMSFPLVLFIFPATFIVLAGPTVIRMISSGFLD